METLKNKEQKIFCCETCEFKTIRNTDYRRHLITKKHIDSISPMKKKIKKNICECGKVYKHRSGLCRHRPVCSVYLMMKLDKEYEENNENNSIETDDEYNNDEIEYEEIENNETNTLQKSKECMIVENHKHKKDVFDIEENEIEANKSSTSSKDNNNDTEQDLKYLLTDIAQQLRELKETRNTEPLQQITKNYNHNYVFNLNMFLNENCKDALSLQDFVKQISFVFDDLKDKSWRSKVLLNNLGSLQLENRPFHCLDTTTCQVVMKNGTEWQEGNKDDIVSTLDKCGRHVQQKFGPQWETQFPEWINSEKYSKRYMSLLHNITREPTSSQIEDELKHVSKETILKPSNTKQMLSSNQSNTQNIK